MGDALTDVEARHQARRDAAADAICSHWAVVIEPHMWQPTRYEPPPPGPPEDVKLPTGVSYQRTNGTGTAERQRPYMVMLYENGRSIPLGHFADVETAARYRTWALEQKAAGKHWKLTLDERQVWEQRVVVSETAPSNPRVGDIWVRP